MTRRPAAARRAVLAGAAVFAAGQVGLNVAVDTVRPGWRDPEHGVRLTHLRHASGDGRPVGVVFGSSRLQMGFDPDSLGDLPGRPRVQVMAQAGCRGVGVLLARERVRAAGVRPAVVLVEILPAALADARPAERALAPEQLTLTDVRQAAPFVDDPAGLGLTVARGRLLPAHTFRANLLSAWGGGHLLPEAARKDFLWKQARPSGWMPYFHEAVPADQRRAGLHAARAEYGAALAHFRVEPGPADVLREVAARAAADGARVAFVVAPESPAFRSWYRAGARDDLTHFYADLTRRTGAPVFDASDWPFAEDDFADGHHLLRHAARDFTRRLGAECVGPWLAGDE